LLVLLSLLLRSVEVLDTAETVEEEETVVLAVSVTSDLASGGVCGYVLDFGRFILCKD